VATERELHKRFASHHVRLEWFVLSDEIVRFIETNCRPFLLELRKVGMTPEVNNFSALNDAWWQAS
jgi:hypothetical protein